MANPNQENIESRLATYVDEALDDQHRLEIEQHLQQNPQYRRVIDDLGKQRDWIRALPREAAPPELAEAFTSQLERAVLLDSRGAAARRKSGRPMSRVLAAAAIVFLTLGLAAIVYFVLPDRTGHPIALATPSTRPAANSGSKEVDAEADEAKKDALATTVFREGQTPAAGGADARAGAVAPDEKRVAVALADSNRGGAPAPRTTSEAMAKLSFTGQTAATATSSLASTPPPAPNLLADDLVQTVARDAQVQSLLETRPSLIAGQGRAIARKRTVVLVARGDSRQALDDLAAYFHSANIAYEPAPSPVELALNTTLSRRLDEGEAGPVSVNNRSIDIAAVERGAGAEMSLRSIRKAAELVDGSDGAGLPQTLPAGESIAPADAPAGGGAGTTGGRAMAIQPISRAAPFAEESTMGRRQQWRAQGAAVDRLYVARGLTSRQAEALAAWLRRDSAPQALGLKQGTPAGTVGVDKTSEAKGATATNAMHDDVERRAESIMKSGAKPAAPEAAAAIPTPLAPPGSVPGNADRDRMDLTAKNFGSRELAQSAGQPHPAGNGNVNVPPGPVAPAATAPSNDALITADAASADRVDVVVVVASTKAPGEVIVAPPASTPASSPLASAPASATAPAAAFRAAAAPGAAAAARPPTASAAPATQPTTAPASLRPR